MRCAVYRCYDKAGYLLYVGHSADPVARWRAHKLNWASPWKHDVVRIVAVWFPDREDARRAERIAIEREQPKFNIQHSQGRNRKQRWGPPFDMVYP